MAQKFNKEMEKTVMFDILKLVLGILLGVAGFIGSENASVKGNVGRTVVFVVVMVIGILFVLAGFVGMLRALSY